MPTKSQGTILIMFFVAGKAMTFFAAKAAMIRLMGALMIPSVIRWITPLPEIASPLIYQLIKHQMMVRAVKILSFLLKTRRAQQKMTY